MRTFWSAWTLVVLITAAAGCANPGTSPQTGITGSASAGVTALNALPIEFSRTGGLVGVDEQATVSAEGLVTITRGGASDTPQPLDGATFAQLKQLLADVPASGPSPTPSSAGVCADGYQYRLRTPSWSAATDDCSLQNWPILAPIVRLLTPLLGATAAPSSHTTTPQ